MPGGYTKAKGGRGGARGGGKFTKKRSNENNDTPRYTKKAKVDEEDEEEEDAGAFIPELKKEGNGDHYISLKANDTRRVTISEFKGKLMVSIREYYESDGKKLPGKKGISLPLDQYNALLASAPLIESVLVKNKAEVVRPDYAGGATAAAPADEEAEAEEEVAEPVNEVEDKDDDEPINKADDEDEE